MTNPHGPLDVLWFEALEKGSLIAQFTTEPAARHARAQLYRLRKRWQRQNKELAPDGTVINAGTTPYDNFTISVKSNYLHFTIGPTLEYEIVEIIKPPTES